jgi:hypothetical protein
MKKNEGKCLVFCSAVDLSLGSIFKLKNRQLNFFDGNEENNK